MKGKKRIKVDGNIAISEEALEKIRRDAVNDYKKVPWKLQIWQVYFEVFKLWRLESDRSDRWSPKKSDVFNFYHKRTTLVIPGLHTI